MIKNLALALLVIACNKASVVADEDSTYDFSGRVEIKSDKFNHSELLSLYNEGKLKVKCRIRLLGSHFGVGDYCKIVAGKEGFAFQFQSQDKRLAVKNINQAFLYVSAYTVGLDNRHSSFQKITIAPPFARVPDVVLNLVQEKSKQKKEFRFRIVFPEEDKHSLNGVKLRTSGKPEYVTIPPDGTVSFVDLDVSDGAFLKRFPENVGLKISSFISPDQAEKYKDGIIEVIPEVPALALSVTLEKGLFQAQDTYIRIAYKRKGARVERTAEIIRGFAVWYDDYLASNAVEISCRLIGGGGKYRIVSGATFQHSKKLKSHQLRLEKSLDPKIKLVVKDGNTKLPLSSASLMVRQDGGSYNYKTDLHGGVILEGLKWKPLQMSVSHKGYWRQTKSYSKLEDVPGQLFLDRLVSLNLLLKSGEGDVAHYGVVRSGSTPEIFISNTNSFKVPYANHVYVALYDKQGMCVYFKKDYLQERVEIRLRSSEMLVVEADVVSSDPYFLNGHLHLYDQKTGVPLNVKSNLGTSVKMPILGRNVNVYYKSMRGTLFLGTVSEKENRKTIVFEVKNPNLKDLTKLPQYTSH